MTAAIEAGHTVTLPSANTIADGTAVKKSENRTSHTSWKM